MDAPPLPAPDVRTLLNDRAPGWTVLEDGRIRIRETPRGGWVDVVQLAFGGRICDTESAGHGYHRGWDYMNGTNSIAGLVAAITAAVGWDGAADSEPDGWTRAHGPLPTGEPSPRRHRPAGDPAQEYTED